MNLLLRNNRLSIITVAISFQCKALFLPYNFHVEKKKQFALISTYFTPREKENSSVDFDE